MKITSHDLYLAPNALKLNAVPVFMNKMIRRLLTGKKVVYPVGAGLFFCAVVAVANESSFSDDLPAVTVSNAADDVMEMPVKTQESQSVESAMPKAENIDLEEPVVDEQATVESKPEPEHQTVESAPDQPTPPETPPIPAVKPEQAQSLVLLGKEIQPGIATRLPWSPEQSFEGIASPTPVLVAHGSRPGPVLCLTAAIHGDELNGIEIVRRVLYNLNADKLSGTVIGVPIVNLQGFHRTSRYLTDRRDLNRYFPGNPEGSSAARIAYSFFNQVIKHCDALVDLHTGSFHRTNLPQLRADLSQPEVVELTHGFGATVVLHSESAPGTLRHAAVEAGIPAVTLEAGGPMELQENAVSHGVKGIQTLLNKMGMQKKARLWGEPEPVYYQSVWVRANRGGILFSKVKLGERVKAGGLLGVITNPITNVKEELVSPGNGRVLGMAVNQVVQPGFAAFRVGIQKKEEQMVPPEPVPAKETLDDSLSPPATPPPTEVGEEEPDLAVKEIEADNNPTKLYEASE